MLLQRVRVLPTRVGDQLGELVSRDLVNRPIEIVARSLRLGMLVTTIAHMA
jgi:hypothetical protein